MNKTWPTYPGLSHRGKKRLGFLGTEAIKTCRLRQTVLVSFDVAAGDTANVQWADNWLRL